MKTVKSDKWFRYLAALRGSAAIALLAGLFLPAMTLRASADLPAEPPPYEWIAAWMDDLRQSNERWIEVNLSEQTLNAWEGDTLISSVVVSTGRSDEPTLPGVFAIEQKYERAWMEGEDYEVPNVPFAMYYSGSYAIHGAYWHNDFGIPISNGCINVPLAEAEWLYSWADVGTPVIIEP